MRHLTKLTDNPILKDSFLANHGAEASSILSSLSQSSK